jgi:hypothetical protein
MKAVRTFVCVQCVIRMKMMKRTFTLLLFAFSLIVNAAPFSKEVYPDTDTLKPNNSRLLLITGVNVAGYGGSLVILNRTWYKNFPKSSFHTFNDSKEWLQMDKIGHAWAAYNTGRITTAMWKYAGLTEKKAVIISGLTSTAYLTVIELMDAHSQKWGWSWSDMSANVFGSGLFMSQQLGWHEQRIQMKFSFHRHYYPDNMTKERSDELFGDSWAERMLKDYNAQTHWLSFNIRSFFKESKWPEWLNVAVGYGADGLLGGYENTWNDETGNPVTRNDISRKRQFYLSPDIDFTKIKTSKKIGKVIFGLLNILKMPAPALMIDSKGKFRAYAFYF